ncbi:MAG: hypothetical protein OQJ91_14590 [Motiliproteus sp.]|nr:hypothetical protein [Motiliproteus sp.]
MLTQHAEQRIQQRSISESSIDLLTTYGEVDYHRGAEIYFFSKRSWNRLCRDKACSTQQKDKLKNCYAVLADGRVITVGHKTHRFKQGRH